MLSNFEEVKRKAKSIGYKEPIQKSTRQGKKYMIKKDNKTIHFGASGMGDFTGHKDTQRRANFRSRNHKWKDAPKYTPAHLSYHILW